MASSAIDVYVKIPTGRNAQYIVNQSDTIEDLCEKIAREENVKVTQVRLKYQGKILSRQSTLSSLGVLPETILKAEILVPREIHIVTTLPKGLGETTLTATSLDTVSSVISKVATLSDEPVSRIVIKCEGREVKGYTLMDAGIVEGSQLVVEISGKMKGTDSVTEEGNELEEEERMRIVNSFQLRPGHPVEVVFSFDTTGSMFNCLEQVRQKLRECCTRLIQDIPNVRIGLVAHGDYCDAKSSYVIRMIDLTSDVQALVDFASSVPITGGGDAPECYEWVLRKAQTLDWSENAAKVLVVIGDCTPHPPGYTDQHLFWQNDLAVLTGLGVKVYGVQAMNNSGAAPFYEHLALVSGGQYLKLKHFDVITDMFLAVCYRAYNEEALKDFLIEVEADQRMNNERQEMFQQLEVSETVETRSSPSRYVAVDWWDPALYTGCPKYHYDCEQDSWMSYHEYITHSRNTSLQESTILPNLPVTTSADPETRCVSLRNGRHGNRWRRRKHGQKSCSIM